MDEPDVQGDNTSQPQFRTYASDVAKLTGKPLPASVKNTPAPPPKPFEPPPAKIIPKAPTTDETRESVLERLRAKATGEPLPTAPVQHVVPSAPSTDEAREEVLARLRGKATAPAPQPVAPSVPPPAPKPEPAPAPITPPIPPAPVAPAPPPGIPPVSKQMPEATPSPIHTYKSDFSDKAKETGASRISILAAEQNAKSTAAPITQLKTPKKNNTLVIVSAVLLIIAGGASMYFAYTFVTGHPPVLVQPSVPSLIFADEHAELRGTSSDLQEQLVGLTDASLPDNGVLVAYMTYSTTTAKKEVITLPASGGTLIRALNLPAPDILLRNIGEESTVGVIRADGETRPFFIFRVASFERTFAGMLSWEDSMGEDLDAFYPDYPVAMEASTASTTSMSTSTTPITAKTFGASFVDDVVDNHDVRLLKDLSGRTVLLYGYRDKQTLIIVRNEAAFSEIVSRLDSTRSQ